VVVLGGVAVLGGDLADRSHEKALLEFSTTT